MCLLGRADDFRDVDTRDEEFQVLHHCKSAFSWHYALLTNSLKLTLLGAVLAVEDRKLSEDTHLSSTVSPMFS
jgi:hypothetical protein